MFYRLYISVRAFMVKVIYKVVSINFKTNVKSDNVLVFRSAALGDFIISLPAFRLLRKLYPNHKITLITLQSSSKEQKSKVIKYTGKDNLIPWVDFAVGKYVDDVIFVSSVGINYTRSELKPIIEKLNPADTFIFTDPSAPAFGVIKKIIWLRLAGVKSEIYGWRDFGTMSRFRNEQREDGLFRHHVHGPLRSVCESPLSHKIETISVEFEPNINDLDIKWANDEMMSLSQSKKKIGISLGSVQLHKRWPVEKYIELCNSISSNYDVEFILTGVAGDIELSKVFKNNVKAKTLDLVGKTSVGRLAAILMECDVVIGNDGGSMHMANAVKTRTISIVPGIEFPNSIEPWDSIDYAVRHQTECAPCYNFVDCPLGHNKCMNDISVEKVLSKFKEIAEKDDYTIKQNRILQIVRSGEKISLIEQ